MSEELKNIQQSVKEVKELHSYHDGVNALNKLLSEGWVLLSTASGKDEQEYPIHTWIVGRID
ncbi:hypothetical protein FEI68_10355 [Salmonella enterica subsp. enterica serovar Javiana]|nr:hypothetical protein [Salmonella enterica subsp. enterica serovar Javiana]ECD7686636.1 hypothetical protein [Salmonella enterica subsp. enterica serovar Javiana]HEC9576323.1 hypothetical protein [Salmonella enterica subsp. enterica serovar Stanley]